MAGILCFFSLLLETIATKAYHQIDKVLQILVILYLSCLVLENDVYLPYISFTCAFFKIFFFCLKQKLQQTQAYMKISWYRYQRTDFRIPEPLRSSSEASRLVFVLL